MTLKGLVSAPKEALDENTVQLKSLATGETKLELTAVLKKMTNVGR